MKPTNFYEVTEADGKDALWGGASALSAVEWLRRGLDYRLFVSVWDESTEDYKMITDKIEVTNLIHATIVDERDRWL
jgi:hypothetical protein